MPHKRTHVPRANPTQDMRTRREHEAPVPAIDRPLPRSSIYRRNLRCKHVLSSHVARTQPLLLRRSGSPESAGGVPGPTRGALRRSVLDEEDAIPVQQRRECATTAVVLYENSKSGWCWCWCWCWCKACGFQRVFRALLLIYPCRPRPKICSFKIRFAHLAHRLPLSTDGPRWRKNKAVHP